MTPEAGSPGNCKSSVSISRERASRSIYFEPGTERLLASEKEKTDPIVEADDRIAAMNSRTRLASTYKEYYS